MQSHEFELILSNVKQCLDKIDGKIGNISDKVQDIEEKIKTLDCKLEKVNEKVQEVEGKTQSIDATLIIQAAQLGEHIRRTELLEGRTEVLVGRVMSIEKIFSKVKYVFYGAGWTGAIFAGAIKIPDFIKFLLALLG
jgi:archaellum component FlaC